MWFYRNCAYVACIFEKSELCWKLEIAEKHKFDESSIFKHPVFLRE